jgi:predicted Rossmann fold flavoprotein
MPAHSVETLVLGAGAAGLFCAAHAGCGTPGRTLVVDHAKRPAEKVRISGGGRCNFTNTTIDRARMGEAFLGENPHFAKSALSRYTPWDFVDLVDRHGIAWHEKTSQIEQGQLFCDGSSKEIIAMLLAEARGAGAEVWLETQVGEIARGPDDAGGFTVTLDRGGAPVTVTARNLVLATGGKSIPKMGATGLAYEIAARFGHRITDTRPALVPFTFPDGRFAPLAGVALDVHATCGAGAFHEALLFTHRGLSGPAMLQVSSYWREGREVSMALAPPTLADDLKAQKRRKGRHRLTTELARHLPARLVEHLAPEFGLTGNLADQSDAKIDALCERLADWRLTPQGTEGYRTAEVTLGGVATDALSAKTLESALCPGLYIIGEAVDVTGWLGGYNFQWAWASAHAAGRAIADKRA